VQLELLELDVGLEPLAEDSFDFDERFRSMVGAHFDAVARSLRRLGVPPCSVDDGVQQVFLVALRRLPEIRSGGERAYLFGVAFRVASAARRAERRRREVPLDFMTGARREAASVTELPDEELDHKRAIALLGACLDQLPDTLRDAFLLFDVEELSALEVARILSLPVGTVASRVRRARQRIRRAFNPGRRCTGKRSC